MAKLARAKEFEPQNPCSKLEPVDVRTPGHEPWNYAFVDYDLEPEVTSPFMGTLWQSKVPISHRLHESPIRYAAVEPVPVVVDEVAFAFTVVSRSWILMHSTILQVLKVLLTAVATTKFKGTIQDTSSTTCDYCFIPVHGEPLLGVIRICYNIALNSKSPINLATSKAMLTQMINIVFRRIESDQVPISSSSSPGYTEPSSASSMQPNNGEISMDEQEDKKYHFRRCI
ncbi:hypothetical protein J5N97_029888 [Dioscorea zingiberensis]|uniref:Mon2/Sec7/BIG1-like dimerisation and cyclophilin-binding domain-containing protein n=1 Tax=Dioscorea zingiberensis TaxID=325984 RepID=A0A9D5BWN0_9LILI|nr:hypothetical protein J5N97_029888 [Dioscorea zingiberensis]